MKVIFSGAEDELLNTQNMIITEEEIAKKQIRTLSDVIHYVYKSEPRARRSFYKTDGTLANGTICMLDEQDSDIWGDAEVEVTPESEIIFISTLHGG